MSQYVELMFGSLALAWPFEGGFCGAKRCFRVSIQAEMQKPVAAE